MPNFKHANKRGSLQLKLLSALLVATVLPGGLLIAAYTTGMYLNYAIFAAIACQVSGLILGFQFISQTSRQAATINTTLASINSGDFEARADDITNDELGQTAAALNTMCDNTLNLIQSNGQGDEIQNSIENLIAEMQEIAAGDLTIQTAVNPDMTGTIADSVNQMTAQLRSIIRRVQTAAQQVTQSSSSIRKNSTAMSQDSELQAKRIGKASEKLLDMTASFQHVASMTEESMHVAVDARQTASQGLKAVSNTVDGMQRIRNQVQGTTKRFKRLGESTQEIGEIVQLISDIADRTSILALNASIQAAMAGDAGQGFAVVAEEIEGLAERSTDATKQISKLIRSIQSETSEVTSDMEEVSREVVAGSELAAQAGVKLFEIDSVSNQLVELIQSSSTSALEQADQANSIATSMAQISNSTQRSADKSRSATHAVGRLADMVNQLRDSVSQFKIADGEIDFSVMDDASTDSDDQFDTSWECESNEEFSDNDDSSSPTGSNEPEVSEKIQTTREIPSTVTSGTFNAKSKKSQTKDPRTEPRQPIAKTVISGESDSGESNSVSRSKVESREVPATLKASKGIHEPQLEAPKDDSKAKRKGRKKAPPRSQPTPKTMVVKEPCQEIPENLDDELLRQVKEATALFQDVDPSDADASSEKPPVRQSMPTIATKEKKS